MKSQLTARYSRELDEENRYKVLEEFWRHRELLAKMILDELRLDL